MLPSQILFDIIRRVGWAHVLGSDLVRIQNLLDRLDTLPSRSTSMLGQTTSRATFNGCLCTRGCK